MQKQSRPQLFACFGYTDDSNPTSVTLYRDRAASKPAASFPVDDPAAPKRQDERYELNGTVYRLTWID